MPKLTAIVIFGVTYFAVLGHVPGFKIDRAGAAFVGASLMVAFGVFLGCWGVAEQKTHLSTMSDAFQTAHTSVRRSARAHENL
jgi:hypothetical protein